MPPTFWRKLNSKARSRIMKGLQGRILFRITRVQRKEIGILAQQIGIPGKRLKEHFDKMRQSGIGYSELGNRMVQDLKEAGELIQKTSLDPKMFKKNIASRPLAGLLSEMRNHAQQMEQMEKAKAAA